MRRRYFTGLAAGIALGVLAVVGHLAIAASIPRGGQGGGGGGITNSGTTDNQLVRQDGTSGNLQASAWSEADGGVLTAGGNLDLNGNTIADTNDSIICIDPDGDGTCDMFIDQSSTEIRYDPDEDGDVQFVWYETAGAGYSLQCSTLGGTTAATDWCMRTLVTADANIASPTNGKFKLQSRENDGATASAFELQANNMDYGACTDDAEFLMLQDSGGDEMFSVECSSNLPFTKAVGKLHVIEATAGDAIELVPGVTYSTIGSAQSNIIYRTKDTFIAGSFTTATLNNAQLEFTISGGTRFDIDADIDDNNEIRIDDDSVDIDGNSDGTLDLVVSANGFEAQSTKNHGTITLSGGTGTATTFTGAICVCSDTTAANAVQCSVSTTTLTANGTGSDVIAYVCM